MRQHNKKLPGQKAISSPEGISTSSCSDQNCQCNKQPTYSQGQVDVVADELLHFKLLTQKKVVSPIVHGHQDQVKAHSSVRS